MTRLRWSMILTLLAITAGGGLALHRWSVSRHFSRAISELQRRDYPRALESLNRYLAHRPADARAHLLAARVNRKLQEYFQAGEHLRKCRELSGDPEAISVETDLIGIQRGGEPSNKLRDRVDQDDEVASEILEVLIQYDIDRYQLRPAIHGLTRYLALHPGDLQALLARAHVWERFLYFTDALEDYRTAVTAHPDNEQARLKAGQGELKAGTPAAALEHFSWLVERHPEKPAVRLGLARCHRALGEPGRAAAILDQLVKEHPGDGEGLLERGLLEMDAGKAREAEPWLRRAIVIQPHDRRFVHALERCCLALGKKDEADQLKKRVAEIESDLSKLDKLLLEVMKNPRDVKLRCEAAKVFLRNGEREEARKWLRLALRLDPGDRQAQETLNSMEKSDILPTEEANPSEEKKRPFR